MPPIDNKNNDLNFKPVKIDIGSVFKSGINTQSPQKPEVREAANSAYNVLNNQQYPVQNTPSVNQQPIERKNTMSSVVRTYKDDMQAAIMANHLSSINIAVAENQKMNERLRATQEQAASKSDYSKNKIIIFISIILVMAGLLGIGLPYIFSNKGPSVVSKVQELPSLISTEHKDELNISQIPEKKFIQALSDKLNDIQIPVNSLYNAHLTTGTSTGRRLIQASEFVSFAEFDMPDILRRTLRPDFMVGSYSLGGNLPFVILKTSYFENAYAGMLGWEINLESDFRVLFRLPGYENGTGLLEELTPTVFKKFTDGVIINKDVRLLTGEDGQVLLLYGIVDQETIVITVNETAFKEVVNRLNKEKGLKR